MKKPKSFYVEDQPSDIKRVSQSKYYIPSKGVPSSSFKTRASPNKTIDQNKDLEHPIVNAKYIRENLTKEVIYQQLIYWYKLINEFKVSFAYE